MIRWFINFPKKNFHIIHLEQWKMNPHMELMKILQFLDVPVPFVMNDSTGFDQLLRQSTRLRQPNSLSWNLTVPPHLRVIMNDFYKPYHDRLEALLQHEDWV